MKLIIDRDIWLRGEENTKSRLLRRQDGKMCCMGIYGRALGIRDDDLLDVFMVSGCRGNYPSWTKKSDVIAKFYRLNDISGIPDGEREAKLFSLFAAQNIDVEFVN